MALGSDLALAVRAALAPHFETGLSGLLPRCMHAADDGSREGKDREFPQQPAFNHFHFTDGVTATNTNKGTLC